MNRRKDLAVGGDLCVNPSSRFDPIISLSFGSHVGLQSLGLICMEDFPTHRRLSDVLRMPSRILNPDRLARD